MRSTEPRLRLRRLQQPQQQQQQQQRHQHLHRRRMGKNLLQNFLLYLKMLQRRNLPRDKVSIDVITCSTITGRQEMPEMEKVVLVMDTNYSYFGLCLPRNCITNN